MNYITSKSDWNRECFVNTDGEFSVNVKFRNPNEFEGVRGISDDPITTAFFYEKGVKTVEKPEFLSVDPSILTKGLVTQDYDSNFGTLEEKILNPCERGIRVDFPNQFILLNLPDGKQGLYMAKIDFESRGANLDIRSEIYLQRIEKRTERFIRNNGVTALENEQLAFDIQSNHLSQYLAWEYLINNPNIQFVALSGKAGSGKTLLAYLGGLDNVLVDSKEDVVNKKYKYHSMRLLKPATPPTEHAVGFLPGDLHSKLGPQMQTFRDLHNDNIVPGFPYAEALSPQQPNRYDKAKIYFPTKNHPLIVEDTVAFAKGSTWGNQWIIVDEAEDLKRRDGVGLATRIGIGSKMIFCGDPYQTHNPKCTPSKNGLVHLAHQYVLNQHPQFAMIQLGRTNRSPVANAAAGFPDYRD